MPLSSIMPESKHPRIELTEAVAKILPSFASLSLKEKTCQILQVCATTPEVGAALCMHMRGATN